MAEDQIRLFTGPFTSPSGALGAAHLGGFSGLGADIKQCQHRYVRCFFDRQECTGGVRCEDCKVVISDDVIWDEAGNPTFRIPMPDGHIVVR